MCLAFGLNATGNELPKSDIHNYVWRHLIKLPINSVYTIFMC